MSKIGNNIKKIRNVKKLSQTGFADIFGLSRTSIGAYEEGRAEPKTDTIIQISQYFNIPIDSLLTKEITVNEVNHFNIFDVNKIGNTKKKSNTDHDYINLIYLDQHLEFIKNPTSSFPKIVLPNTHSDFNCAFEEPLTKNILIGKNAPLSTIKEDRYYVIQVSNQLLFATLESINKEHLIVFSMGRNTEINKSEIEMVWLVTGIFSTSIEMKQTPIERKIEELEQRLKKIEKGS